MLSLRPRLYPSSISFSRSFTSLRSSTTTMVRLRQQFSSPLLKMYQRPLPSRESTDRRWDQGWDHSLRVIVILRSKSILGWQGRWSISLSHLSLLKRRACWSQLIILRLSHQEGLLDRLAVIRVSNLTKIEIIMVSRFFQRGKYLILRLLEDSSISKIRTSKRKMSHLFQLLTHSSLGQKSWNLQKMSWWNLPSNFRCLIIKKRKLDWLWC